MKAHLRQVRISPKKANLIASLVRRMDVTKAVDILKFTPKRTAPVLRKLILSAAANAQENFKQAKEDLYIKEIIVTEGPTYKRSMPVSRGRANPILKRTSHITVTVEKKPTEVKPKEVKAKKESNTEENTTNPNTK